MSQPLASDSPEFAHLRPDLVRGVREMEVNLRTGMELATAGIADMTHAEILQLLWAMPALLPANFIRTMLPFLKMLNDLQTAKEELDVLLALAGGNAN
jgi:hypothetical protein